MLFTDGTLSSCTEISLTSLKDIELCFKKKVIFSSFCILCFYIFVSFTSYNPDTGIKDPHLVLNFRIQHPKNS